MKANLNDHLFIFAEYLRGQPRSKDIVDILKEAFLLDVLVGEEEGGALALDAARAVQHLEVLEEIIHIVRPGHRHLESLVS